MLVMRPIIKKLMNFEKQDTNLGRNIGKEGVVEAEINNKTGTGQVNVSGTIWTARAQGDYIIQKGENVVVTAIEGVKLIVKPI
jgi:membrane protein implicated in regulation of membrane protease activity